MEPALCNYATDKQRQKLRLKGQKFGQGNLVYLKTPQENYDHVIDIRAFFEDFKLNIPLSSYMIILLKYAIYISLIVHQSDGLFHHK